MNSPIDKTTSDVAPQAFMHAAHFYTKMLYRCFAKRPRLAHCLRVKINMRVIALDLGHYAHLFDFAI